MRKMYRINIGYLGIYTRKASPSTYLSIKRGGRGRRERRSGSVEDAKLQGSEKKKLGTECGGEIRKGIEKHLNGQGTTTFR